MHDSAAGDFTGRGSRNNARALSQRLTHSLLLVDGPKGHIPSEESGATTA